MHCRCQPFEGIARVEECVKRKSNCQHHDQTAEDGQSHHCAPEIC